VSLDYSSKKKKTQQQQQQKSSFQRNFPFCSNKKGERKEKVWSSWESPSKEKEKEKYFNSSL
jgi:hypothetical protein